LGVLVSGPYDIVNDDDNTVRTNTSRVWGVSSNYSLDNSPPDMIFVGLGCCRLTLRGDKGKGPMLVCGSPEATCNRQQHQRMQKEKPQERANAGYYEAYGTKLPRTGSSTRS
jgi:hypothetical protein